MRTFTHSIGTKLPVYGVEIPARTLAQISLCSGDWVHQDESWKHVQQLLSTDRSYALAIRGALYQEYHNKKATHAYLYSLKESKVCLLPSDGGGMYAS